VTLKDVFSHADVRLHHEYLWGYNHRAWRYHNRLHGIDVGGPWLKYDLEVILGGNEGLNMYWSTVANQRITGPYCASVDVANIISNTPSNKVTDYSNWISGYMPHVLSDSALDALGATAVSRVAPTHPVADLSQALGELIHDGLPSLPGKGGGNIGNEYLNQQFEWSPTISDGRSFIKSIRDYDAIAHQYVRDSGRMVRRRYDFPIIRTSSTTTSSPYGIVGITGAPAVPGQMVNLGTMTKTVTTEVRTWFEGTFTYLLPSNALLRTVQVLDKAYGLVPGPDTAWALTPWSWLVDWFSNAGDVMRNLNAFTEQGLVMPYGYVMTDQISTTEYFLQCGVADKSGTIRPYNSAELVIARSRQRRRANPFGFGLTMGGLSPFQISILAALGIALV
jgi:hypothetical protein